MAMVSGITRVRIGLKAATGDERERDGLEDKENIYCPGNAPIMAGIHTNMSAFTIFVKALILVFVKALILVCMPMQGLLQSFIHNDHNQCIVSA